MLILFSLSGFIALEPLLHRLSLDIYRLTNVDCEAELLVSTPYASSTEVFFGLVLDIPPP
jgi:hypothetical protein